MQFVFIRYYQDDPAQRAAIQINDKFLVIAIQN